MFAKIFLRRKELTSQEQMFILETPIKVPAPKTGTHEVLIESVVAKRSLRKPYEVMIFLHLSGRRDGRKWTCVKCFSRDSEELYQIAEACKACSPKELINQTVSITFFPEKDKQS